MNRRMGFKVLKVLKDDRGPGIDTIFFRKVLG
jgi:hypothetical protein